MGLLDYNASHARCGVGPCNIDKVVLLIDEDVLCDVCVHEVVMENHLKVLLQSARDCTLCWSDSRAKDVE